jgi:fumarate reductase iron-sulfur subunit
VPNRTLKFSIFRYNPDDASNGKPKLEEYELDETPYMTLFTALTRIREDLDPSLAFDFACRSAVCGSCGMMVNGRPRLACKTLTADLPAEIALMPLPFFRLIADLSVDTGAWFRAMEERVESWIHTEKSFDPNAEEARMSNEDAQLIYELDRCIECGCCISACPTVGMREDFLGAAGLLRIARFVQDSRDERHPSSVYEVVGTDGAVFGCIGLLACHDYCPKDLPLMTQLAYLRRKILGMDFRGEAKA